MMITSYSSIKRALDIVIVVILLPVFLIPLVIIALGLALPGGSVLFIQPRIGQDLKPFRMFKFRTMHDSAQDVQDESQRITKMGRFLRKYHLDELPQIFNVLAGQMSLVGPRPLLCSYLDAFPEEYLRRHQVKPGLTGLVQIEGGNDLCWDQRFKRDLDYVDQQNLVLDIKILLITMPKLLRPDRHIISSCYAGT